jgi:hypothetical protein
MAGAGRSAVICRQTVLCRLFLPAPGASVPGGNRSRALGPHERGELNRSSATAATLHPLQTGPENMNEQVVCVLEGDMRRGDAQGGNYPGACPREW